jgi:anti-anti-sigma factor
MVGMAALEGDVFSLTVSELGPCRVLAVSGELDEVAAPVVEQAIEDECGAPLIVDLSEVEFICSAGIHALLRPRRERPAIVCPPGNVARVLGIVRAEKTTHVFEDLESAHEAVSAALAGVA